jgi:alkaline phosphatase D
VRYQKGCTAEQGENLAPCFGLQFFGRVDIDGRTGVMTVTLKDVDNTNLWSIDLMPAGEGASRKLAERR